MVDMCSLWYHLYMSFKKRFYYKGIEVNSFGIPVFSNDKKSCVKTKNRKRNFYYITFSSPFKENDSKNLIVMYDIPHNQRKERDWFRRHLVKFGYIMIQKSVWVGPSPLPKSFLDYLKEIKIGENFKTFKLAKSYIKK
ncbi:CRISPR-associated endonuclease Cas2 [Candidatus Nomurabacteria bacterium CG_4_10_14_0_2_um_filter_30_12]|uniref:CRISPR-associated endonuclease Cas2 n=2 Tax=Candidatus Nomuraibacteriota TaxID=1752729 RepID=A0A2J0MGA2_9BACT|nr:MAG: CRISPR-associated endonuclease Cas2 [Candidatus Nomurabacteria bacterium CG10_big_fil_rev_8_21_14_0_10_03_31_7]PIZ87480.1 MAG: CRISPR-associated endonuclease Cas2 [Candidatus Nomurabacteria bacterium CG_4_10_14_0_2_um_filter_30_12]